MADSKITALASIGTGTDPANDPLVIVDVSDVSPGGMSATGTTKKVTLNNLLACSPTATLASATITGNLTVDTSTFAVDAANNRVFVGTAPVSTAYPLFVTRGGTAGSIAQFTDGTAQTLTIDSAAGGLIVGNANNGYVSFTANGLEQYRIAPLGVFTWYDGLGGTRMTLNATGLGVGGSVLAKISAYLTSTATYNSAAAGDDTDFQISRVNNSTVSGQSSTIALNSSSDNGASVARVYLACVQESNGSYASAFTVKTRNSAGTNAERLRIDSTGNVGISVQPSAWNSGWAGGIIQFKNGTSVGNPQNGSGAFLGANVFRDASGNDVYISSDRATRYRQQAGQHQFFYDTGTQTAGANTSLTQAMTLDASANLLVGTTSANGSISNASYVVGGIFSTLNGILLSVATATPTTLFAAPSESTLMVTAYVNGASPSDYKVVAVVKRGGAAVAITTISSATSITITASGTNIQVTQTSGGTQNVYFNVIRLA